MGRYNGAPQEMSSPPNESEIPLTYPDTDPPQPPPTVKQDVGGVSLPPVNQQTTPTNVDSQEVSPTPVYSEPPPTNVDLQLPEQTPTINEDVGGPPPPPIGVRPTICIPPKPKVPTDPPLETATVNQVVGVPWSTGLFDCHEDENNAIVTALVPCITFGQIAEILDAGQTSCALGSLMYILMALALCTCGLISSGYRTKLRSKYNLVEDQGEDWIVHLFCSCCALCQEYRELSNRGIDPSLGWMGILAQQQQQNVATTPPPPQAMYK